MLRNDSAVARPRAGARPLSGCAAGVSATSAHGIAELRGRRRRRAPVQAEALATRRSSVSVGPVRPPRHARRRACTSDAVAEDGQLLGVGRGHQDGRALASRRRHEVVDRGLRADVDALGRLVEQQDARLAAQPLRQHDLLLVAAAEQARAAAPGRRGRSSTRLDPALRPRGARRAKSIRPPAPLRSALQVGQRDVLATRSSSSRRRRRARSAGTNAMPAADRGAPGLAGGSGRAADADLAARARRAPNSSAREVRRGRSPGCPRPRRSRRRGRSRSSVADRPPGETPRDLQDDLARRPTRLARRRLPRRPRPAISRTSASWSNSPRSASATARPSRSDDDPVGEVEHLVEPVRDEDDPRAAPAPRRGRRRTASSTSSPCSEAVGSSSTSTLCGMRPPVERAGDRDDRPLRGAELGDGTPDVEARAEPRDELPRAPALLAAPGQGARLRPALAAPAEVEVLDRAQQRRRARGPGG